MKDKKSYGQHNDLNLKSFVVLSKAYLTVNKKQLKTIKKGGLTLSQFSVLEVLYHKGEMKIGEIIEKTLFTGGNMTVIIENLTKQKLVEKIICQTDKRSVYVKITESGIKIIEAIMPEHVNNISDIFDVLTETEKSILISLLKKLGKENE
ncbi:MAG: MarR family transcriptional regulator [Thermotogae bacterium]|nr:MarR family transcriptional regulator [Thermotogota bacterium]MCP5465209.1 MarR family transcriptional regulator [Thermotogota bacterium]HOO74172.1 MarR family transcriptional regulator [Tepiditoga sp.]